MINVETVKKDFPQLKEGKHYLDTVASSLTPQPVLDAMEQYYKDSRANIHRGLYRESVVATKAYENARDKIAAFIHADSKEIIFTSGSTAGANMLIRMLEESLAWEKGEKVMTTTMEHHGTLVPIQEMAKRKDLELAYINPENLVKDGIPDKTRVVSLLLVSNVLGTKQPVKEVAKIAKQSGAIVICDATAAVGHIPVDVKDLGVDALWFSGHKMLGPTGIGVLWVNSELLSKLSPVTFGGNMVEKVTKEGATWVPAPEKFEAGTPNIAGAIGLGAAVDYLDLIGLADIEKHSATLAFRAHRALEQIPGVKIISPCDPTKNVGTVSFVVDGVHAHDIGQILADKSVAVRSGHHCAMPLHQELGVAATTRASFYLYNSEDDITALVEGIVHAQKIFS